MNRTTIAVYNRFSEGLKVRLGIALSPLPEIRDVRFDDYYDRIIVLHKGDSERIMNVLSAEVNCSVLKTIIVKNPFVRLKFFFKRPTKL